MEFSADTLRLNLIDLARTGSKLITVTGRLDYACTALDHSDPVTFATRDAHLVSPDQNYCSVDDKTAEALAQLEIAITVPCLSWFGHSFAKSSLIMLKV